MVIVTSDHGMNIDGMHGGKNDLESEVPFWIINDNEKIKLSHRLEQVYIASIIGTLLGIDTSEMKNKVESIYRGY